MSLMVSYLMLEHYIITSKEFKVMIPYPLVSKPNDAITFSGQ